MTEIHEEWETPFQSTVLADLDYLVDNSVGLQIFLSHFDSGVRIKVYFPYRKAYRVNDEMDLAISYSRSVIRHRGTFRRVMFSEYLEEFQNTAISRYENLIHYAIVTEGDCIDVLDLLQKSAIRAA